MKILLIAITLCLMTIIWQLGVIQVELVEWRPIQTIHYHNSYDVADVENLTICDAMAE